VLLTFWQRCIDMGMHCPCKGALFLHACELRHKMAPNLACSQHEVLQHMIVHGSLEDKAMAAIAKCSTRTIRTLRAHLRRYGSTTTPYNGV
jgi:hypothetical protein